MNTEALHYEISRLKQEVSMLQGELRMSRENYEKLLARVNASNMPNNSSMTSKTLPPPLSREDYKQVRFWVEKAYDEHCKRNDGETDGFATSKPKRGRPSNSEDDNDKHPYIEDCTGKPVDRHRLSKFGEKARRLFTSLKALSLAMPSWGQLGLEAYEYIKIEMLCDFEEFRFCDGAWKLERWASRAYSSWMQNIRNKQEGESGKRDRATRKRKRSSSSMKILPTDNGALYKMDDDLDTSVSSLTDSVQPRPLTDTSAASTTASNADSPTPGLVPNTPPANPASNADSPTPGMVPNTPRADPASNESLTHAVPLINTPAAKPTSNANSARPRPLADTPAADSTASTVLFLDNVVSNLSNSQPEDRSPHAVRVALVDPFADGVITKHLDGLPRASSHAAKALISPVATMAISQAPSLPSDPLQPDVISSTSQASAVPPATTISSSQIPSVLSSTSASGSCLAAPASTTAVIPPAEAIPHQPLAQTQNSTTDATRPAKKTKMECPAVVGPRLTEKNLAKAAWLAENPGGSGPDFEAHYKTLTPEEKKNFAAQAKIAQKAARQEKRAKAKNGQS